MAAQGDKTASIILIVAGLGLLAASLLADVIGIGDDAGFGMQQTMGTVAGLAMAAIGLYLLRRKTKP